MERENDIKQDSISSSEKSVIPEESVVEDTVLNESNAEKTCAGNITIETADTEEKSAEDTALEVVTTEKFSTDDTVVEVVNPEVPIVDAVLVKSPTNNDGQEEKDINDIYEFYGIKDNQKFYLEDKRIVIYFDLYDIAPYAAGIPEFPIPIDNIKNKIKEEHIQLIILSLIHI